MRMYSNLERTIAGGMVLGSIITGFILTIKILPRLGFRTTDLSLLEMIFLHDKIVVPVSLGIAFLIVLVLVAILNAIDKLMTVIRKRYTRR